MYTIVLGNLTFMKVHDYCCFLFIFWMSPSIKSICLKISHPILFLEFLSFYKVKLSLNSIFFSWKSGGLQSRQIYHKEGTSKLRLVQNGFFFLYFSVRNNTLGSYKVVFFFISHPSLFSGLTSKNRFANLEQIRKKTGNQKAGVL